MVRMITHSRLELDLIRPQASGIDLHDIAQGLSQTCRFNGQTSTFYSVAEHSVRVAYYMLERHRSAPLALAGLFHDAAEAYLPDVHSDLKKYMAGFRDIENRLTEVIFEKYGLAWPMDKFFREGVKEADRILLVTEGRDLMDWDLKDPALRHFPAPLGNTIEPWTMQVAKECFLQTYQNLVELSCTFAGILSRNVCTGYL